MLFVHYNAMVSESLMSFEEDPTDIRNSPGSTTVSMEAPHKENASLSSISSTAAVSPLADMNPVKCTELDARTHSRGHKVSHIDLTTSSPSHSPVLRTFRLTLTPLSPRLLTASPEYSNEV